MNYKIKATEKEISDAIKKIFKTDWSATQIKIYLWQNLLRNKKDRETPIPDDVISKIANEISSPISSVSPILRNMNEKIKPKKEVKESTETPVINSDALSDFINVWTKMTGFKISLDERFLFSSVLNRLEEEGRTELIINAINNFLDYQSTFNKVPNTERAEAYLFRNSTKSFLNNIDKYMDKDIYLDILAEHQKRYANFKNKPVSYGFSPDPIEDKKMAKELELQNICFSLSMELPFKESITFPENKEYYEKQIKKRSKRNG